MQHLISRINSTELAEVLGSLEYTVDGTGVLMGNGQWRGLPHFIMRFSEAQLAVAEIESLTGLQAKHVMVNILEPEVTSGWHSDPTPDGVRFSRWHLPLATNPGSTFWDLETDGPIHLAAGFWHGPVAYWQPHCVSNFGGAPRMHFIVDLALGDDQK